jgi:thioredoxin reductase (NADPH)
MFWIRFGVDMQVEDVMIIGAGPAGLAAAIQLQRYGIHALLFERDEVGGLLRNANLVENYPGFPRGISGARLVKLFVQQASNVGVVVTHAEVTSIAYDRGSFQVETSQGSYQSRLVVIATGTKPLHIADLSIPGELQSRVFYEVHELVKVEGKCVAIVGGGDAAFDYALNLGQKNQVTLLNRGEKPKCLPLLWERARMVDSIVYHDHTFVQKITKDLHPGMLVDCQTQAGELQFHADYLIIAIGREANMDCLSDEFRLQTSMLEKQGLLYIIGDVRNGIFRQASIAVGEGVLTAMKVYRYMKEML